MDVGVITVNCGRSAATPIQSLLSHPFHPAPLYRVTCFSIDNNNVLHNSPTLVVKIKSGKKLCERVDLPNCYPIFVNYTPKTC
jgi:hypothetical protein